MVAEVMAMHKLSQRRACGLIGITRRAYQFKVRADRNLKLRKRLRELAEEKRRWTRHAAGGLDANTCRRKSDTKRPFGSSHKDYEVADSLVNSLLGSNNLLPNQWAGMLGRRAENRELHLLWGFFYWAWEDLRSPRIRIRSEAARFFAETDAGKPLSLRFLCEVFDLDLNAVQLMAWARIAEGVQRGADDEIFVHRTSRC